MKNIFAALVVSCFTSIALAGPIWVLDINGQAQGEVKINLRADLAPKHVERIVKLTNEGEYDNIVFHRVIDGFMAQTGDVEFGKKGGDMIDQAGRGASSLPDLPAEFSDVSFQKGVVGMARSQNPNSANSQFFIMLAPGEFLVGKYTVIGEVVDGQGIVDAIKKGDPNNNGAVEGEADFISSARIEKGVDG